MDNVREKLVEIVQRSVWGCARHWAEVVADGLIANGVTVQQWIPASEPPKSIVNKVIVLCKNDYRGFGHYEKEDDTGVWYNLETQEPFTNWDLDDCESYEVTHWMPLPEGLKGV